MKIAIVDTYFSGSHKQWGLDLKNNSKYQIQLFTLKGIHWKWRMQGGAIKLAQKINKSHFFPNLILVTDMVNLAVFKSLLNLNVKKIKFILYFHENQLMYPQTENDTDIIYNRDNHYGFINFTSSLIADTILFNSKFHYFSYLQSLRDLLQKFPDYPLFDTIIGIKNKSSVLPVGVHFNNNNNNNNNKIPIILWNHRWEHDKNPELFFKILIRLKREKIKFKVNVIGKKFKQSPKIFYKANEILKNEILNWGYIDSKIKYFNILNQSNIIPITSYHDFFGISTIEAISCGVYPLLPNRLVYPEHIPEELKQYCLYDDPNELNQKLKNIIKNGVPDQKNILLNHIQKYELKKVIKDYEIYFKSLFKDDISTKVLK